MERSWNDGTAVHDQGSQDNLERARRYFERKAGRPVSSAEAREWLDSLVDYLKTAQRWAAEAAMRDASATSDEDVRTDVRTDIQVDVQGSTGDIQPLPPRRASRRIAARGKTGKSTLNKQRNIQNTHTDAHGDVHNEQAARAGRG